MGIASMVLGIIAVIISLIPIIGSIAGIFAFVAIILGIVELVRKTEEKKKIGMAISGVIMSGVSIAIIAFWILMMTIGYIYGEDRYINKNCSTDSDVHIYHERTRDSFYQNEQELEEWLQQFEDKMNSYTSNKVL